MQSIRHGCLRKSRVKMSDKSDWWIKTLHTKSFANVKKKQGGFFFGIMPEIVVRINGGYGIKGCN